MSGEAVVANGIKEMQVHVVYNIMQDNPELMPFDEASLRRIVEQNGESPKQFEQRLAAFRLYKRTAWPGAMDEAWRRTDARQIYPGRLALAIGGIDIRTFSDSTLDNGVVFGRLKPDTALTDVIENESDDLQNDDSPAVKSLHGAFFTPGSNLIVGDDSVVRKPLRIVIESNLPDGGAHLPLNIIRLGRNSRATMIIEQISQSVGRGWFAAQTRIKLDEGARLDLMLINSNTPEVRFYDSVSAQLERNSNLRLTWGDWTQGWAVVKREARVSGSGARAEMRGAHIGMGSSHIDVRSLQKHSGESTESNMLYKSVMFDQSRSVYQGLINVAPQAVMANAYQLNRNLLMSGDARVDSIPKLEILVDEVRCSHGASSGKLDKDALFYLMSRGIGFQEAQSLLINGFLGEVVEFEDTEGLRELWLKRMRERLDVAMQGLTKDKR